MLLFVDKYKLKYPNLFNGNKYFVRSESVSLKYGEHGLVPYTDLRMIIESLITCPNGHTPIYNDTQTIHLYLFEWIELNPANEFRIFVKNKNITCISQQHLYSCYNLNADDLHEKITHIIDYFKTNILNLIDVNDFSFDLTFFNNLPYFIEPNSFGKEYASGSALFHWLIDYDKLYGNMENNIFVRYVV